MSDRPAGPCLTLPACCITLAETLSLFSSHYTKIMPEYSSPLLFFNYIRSVCGIALHTVILRGTCAHVTQKTWISLLAQGGQVIFSGIPRSVIALDLTSETHQDGIHHFPDKKFALAFDNIASRQQTGQDSCSIKRVPPLPPRNFFKA